MLWQVDEGRRLWGALSRAVRTPSRSNRDLQLNVAPGGVSVLGSDSFDAEDMVSLELGYREQLNQQLSFDTALFYSHYDNLYSSESVSNDSLFDNQMEADSYGVELSSNWQPHRDWRLHGSYTWLTIDSYLKAGSSDTTNIAVNEKQSPRHQAQLRSYWDIDQQTELNAALYYVDRIEIKGIEIPAYTRLDLNLGWDLGQGVTLTLGGTNLLEGSHTEFKRRTETAVEVPRTLFGRIEIDF